MTDDAELNELLEDLQKLMAYCDTHLRPENFKCKPILNVIIGDPGKSREWYKETPVLEYLNDLMNEVAGYDPAERMVELIKDILYRVGYVHQYLQQQNLKTREVIKKMENTISEERKEKEGSMSELKKLLTEFEDLEKENETLHTRMEEIAVERDVLRGEINRFVIATRNNLNTLSSYAMDEKEKETKPVLQPPSDEPIQFGKKEDEEIPEGFWKQKK